MRIFSAVTVHVMARHQLTRRQQRWSIGTAAVAVAVPAAVLLGVGGDAVPVKPSDRTDNSHTASAAAAVVPAAAPAPVPAPDPALPMGVARENGLQVKTILTARAVSARFPEILDIGGTRADPLKWHPHGLAIDVMVPDYHTPEGRALGDRVLAYVLENAERFELHHAIWRQTIYNPTRAPRLMRDLGSDNANHFNHVHIATKGGGYPHGREVYLR